MADFNAKAEYDKARHKFPELPGFDALDFEFEISTIETPGFILRRIKDKMHERFEPLMELLQSVIHPDPGSFVHLYECSFFSAEEKELILEICKKIIILKRELEASCLELDDKTDVKVIKKVAEQWPLLRKQAAPIVKKIGEKWQSTKEATEILEYLG